MYPFVRRCVSESRRDERKSFFFPYEPVKILGVFLRPRDTARARTIKRHRSRVKERTDRDARLFLHAYGRCALRGRKQFFIAFRPVTSFAFRFFADDAAVSSSPLQAVVELSVHGAVLQRRQRTGTNVDKTTVLPRTRYYNRNGRRSQEPSLVFSCFVFYLFSPAPLPPPPNRVVGTRGSPVASGRSRVGDERPPDKSGGRRPFGSVDFVRANDNGAKKNKKKFGYVRTERSPRASSACSTRISKRVVRAWYDRTMSIDPLRQGW